jgi:hypothetical protein
MRYDLSMRSSLLSSSTLSNPEISNNKLCKSMSDEGLRLTSNSGKNISKVSQMQSHTRCRVQRERGDIVQHFLEGLYVSTGIKRLEDSRNLD